MLPALARRLPGPARFTKAVRAAALPVRLPALGVPARPARQIGIEARRCEETRVAGVEMRGRWW